MVKVNEREDIEALVVHGLKMTDANVLHMLYAIDEWTKAQIPETCDPYHYQHELALTCAITPIAERLFDESDVAYTLKSTVRAD